MIFKIRPLRTTTGVEFIPADSIGNESELPGDAPWTKYNYNCIYIPTGIKLEYSVYCRSWVDFLMVLDYYNSQAALQSLDGVKWHYYSKP